VSKKIQIGILHYFTEKTKMIKTSANSAFVETLRGMSLLFRKNVMVPLLFF
jgi:hypothetical protein